MSKKAQTPKTLAPEDIRKRAQRIEQMGRGFIAELDKFKRKQKELLEKFIKALEQKKIEEIQKLLKQK